MDIIDPANTRFYSNYIIPEVNDELTVQWGRYMVNNLINGYGIIGTTSIFIEEQTFVSIPISKLFKLPPSITIMYRPYNSINAWTLNPYGPLYCRSIWWSFVAEGLYLKNNPASDLQNYDILYRINGV